MVSCLSANLKIFAHVLLCMWVQAARVKFYFDLFPITSNFKSSPLGKTDHGRSCASAADEDCSPGRCQPVWCPVMCGEWVFLSWPGWALGTYPWVWVRASHGESKDQVASGLWSFLCICGSRLKTLRQLAFCRGKHSSNGERLDSFMERRGAKYPGELIQDRRSILENSMENWETRT